MPSIWLLVLVCTFRKIFSIFELGSKLLRHSNNLSHYLDDFLFVGPSTSDECAKLMHIFTSVCKNLGVPIATDKTEGPTTYITYLGLWINSVSQTLFIPHDKVTLLTEQLNEINNHKKLTTVAILMGVASVLF